MRYALRTHTHIRTVRAQAPEHRNTPLVLNTETPRRVDGLASFVEFVACPRETESCAGLYAYGARFVELFLKTIEW